MSASVLLSSTSSRDRFLTGTASATLAPDTRELVVLVGLDALVVVETGDGGTAPVVTAGKGLGCSCLVFGTLGIGLDGGSSSESVYIGDARLLSLTWPDRLLAEPLAAADFAGPLVCAWLEPTLALPFTPPFELEVEALGCAARGRFFPTVAVVGMLPFARTGGEPLAGASKTTAFFTLPFVPVAVNCVAGAADTEPVDALAEAFFCCLRSSRMSQSSSSWLIFATLLFPFTAVALDPVVLEGADSTAAASSNSSSMVGARAFFTVTGGFVAAGGAGFFPFVVAVAAAISSASTARAAPRLELATSTAAKRSASAVKASYVTEVDDSRARFVPALTTGANAAPPLLLVLAVSRGTAAARDEDAGGEGSSRSSVMIGFDLTLAFVDPEAVPPVAFVVADLGGPLVFIPPRKFDVFHPSEGVRALSVIGVEVDGRADDNDEIGLA